MTDIKSPNRFSSEESENGLSSETLFLPNGELFSSTSNGLSNLLSNSLSVDEMKNNSWRQACLKLSTIFPEVDPEFTKKIYISKLSDKNLRGEEEILQAVVDEVSKNEEKHTRFEISLENSQNPLPETKSNTVDLIQYLSSVFPDANPLYLKTIASQNYDDPGTLEKFVEEKLETRDYPTKDNYVPIKNKKGIEEKEYVDSFDVEEFLKRVPDPFKVYENPERKWTYNIVTFELLKNHFDRISISAISEKYTRCSFNPILAFEALQGFKFDMKQKRKKRPVKTENTEVLQEFAFIVNKQRIKNVIEQKREREQKIIQKMKDNKELLQCECCYEELPALSKYTITCQEGHVFCDNCMRKGTEVELSYGRIRISCFAECTSEFNLISLQKVLKPTTFKILLGKIQEKEVTAAKIEGVVFCPFCHFASIPPENDKVFYCMNPDCGQESCRLCRKPNHLPKECEILEKSKKARLFLEEHMTAALVRRCGNCGKGIVKDGGCNVVTCSCGATVCYSCGQLSISHAHLNGNCAAVTNSTTDAQGVVYVAKKLESQLLEMDPNLKINVDSILPEIPGGSGLYQNNLGSAAVMTHAQKAIHPPPNL